MAAGDVVNGISGADITFQPAAGVECMITSGGWYTDNGFFMNYTNGTINSQFVPNTTYGEVYQPKAFITNSIYLLVQRSTANCSYSGIQIK